MKSRTRTAWIVAISKPQQEQRALHNIRQQQQRCYMPEFFHQRLRCRKPLFPRYLFVQVRDMQWRFLRSTFGVHDVIMAGEHPGVLPVSEIRRFQKAENKNGVITLPAEFKPGDPVRIRHGSSFADHLGIYESMTDQQRINVLMKMMGGEVLLQFERHLIERVA